MGKKATTFFALRPSKVIFDKKHKKNATQGENLNFPL